jgi:hypothetical protein
MKHREVSIAVLKWMRLAVLLALAAAPAAPAAAQDAPDDAQAAPSTAGEARRAFQQFNALRTDRSRIFYVRDLSLRRDAVRLTFTEGKLALLEASGGRVTGAVFTGTGNVTAVPRDPVERRSLAWFLGAPLLDQPFTRAYLRFTDGTADEILRLVQAAGAPPLEDRGFADDWDPTIGNLNPAHSLRILTDELSANPQPYFYAGLAGGPHGAFDVLLDDRREEAVTIGQIQRREGVAYYDIWAAFPRANAERTYHPAFAPASYSLSTTIAPDLRLESEATLRLKVRRGGERMVTFDLSRYLQVAEVTDGRGRPLEFFQNEAVRREDIAEQGNDLLSVVLPEAPRAGEELELRMRYAGYVITDAGNNVFFVGERGLWYPGVRGNAEFATFRLAFRWPKPLVLVASGQRVEHREEGEWRAGRWESQTPVPLAGFNLGEYATQVAEAENFRVEVYANKQLEQALLSRFRQYSVVVTGVQPAPIWPRLPRRTIVVNEPPPLPSPGALPHSLAQDVTDSIRFYEKYHGPFPFESLAVSPIPGSFGQGWPGLLYLSTLSFLTPDAQRRAGLGQRLQEQVNELLPFHEVAHQWWGNTVGTASYRDAWIHEGLASYLSLLYAESRSSDEKFLTAWLDRYRDDLVTREPGSEETPEQAGPLALGARLRSSRTAGAYERILYAKGPWVFHMLRMMLRDPKATEPDERFQRLLSGLLESHRHRPLTTAEFQRAVEKHMTKTMDLDGNGSMDWFFDQWVRGTGIPRYTVEFDVKPAADGRFAVRGTLKQDGVAETFTAAVPLYVPRAAGKPALLGTVVTHGAETRFQFTTRSRPRRILIDPNRTLLCVTE